MRMSANKMKVITHIPHSSMDIPKRYHSQFNRPFETLKTEIFKLNDHFTDKLFESTATAVTPLIFPVNRFLVDPERFEQDSAEPMSLSGMGVFYTHDTNGERFRRDLSADERAALLGTYYHPHHAQLTDMTENSLVNFQQAIIIDCHSFPDLPLPCDENQQQPRPDICLGTDPVHTPSWLISLIADECRQEGLSVNIDAPYSGTIVPSKYFKTENRVMSLMIEINRKLYLDDHYGLKKDYFCTLHKMINRFYEQILRQALICALYSFLISPLSQIG